MVVLTDSEIVTSPRGRVNVRMTGFTVKVRKWRRSFGVVEEGVGHRIDF